MKEEVIEGNKLIAEFMGWKIWYKNGREAFIEVSPEQAKPINEWAQYNTSWDWQIRVWVRLHEMVKNYEPKEPTIRPRPLHADYDKAIESNNIFFQYHKFRESWKHRALEDNNTIAAFEILVKAVQWYNQTHKAA